MLKAYAVRYYCLFKITSPAKQHPAPKPRPSSAGIQGRKPTEPKPDAAAIASDLFEIQVAVRGRQSTNAMVYLLHSKQVTNKWPILAVLIPQVKKVLQEAGMVLLLSKAVDPVNYATVAMNGVQKSIPLSKIIDATTLAYELYPIFDFRKPAAILTTPFSAPHMQSIPAVPSHKIPNNPVTVDVTSNPNPSTNIHINNGPSSVPSGGVQNNNNIKENKVESHAIQSTPVAVSTTSSLPITSPPPVQMVEEVRQPALVPVRTEPIAPLLDPIESIEVAITPDSAADNLAMTYQQLLGNSSDDEEDDHQKTKLPSVMMIGGQESQAFGDESSWQEPPVGISAEEGILPPSVEAIPAVSPTSVVSIAVKEEPKVHADEKTAVPAPATMMIMEEKKKEEHTKPTVTFAPTPPPVAHTTTNTNAKKKVVEEEEEETEKDYAEEDYDEETYDVDFDPISPMNSPERKPIHNNPTTAVAVVAVASLEDSHDQLIPSEGSERRPSQLLVNGQFDEAKKAVLDIKNMLNDDEEDEDNENNDLTMQQSTNANDDEFWDKFDRNLAGSFYDSPSK